VVTPQAEPVIDRLVNLCIERWFDVLTRQGPTQALKRSFLRVDNLTEREPWRRLLEENSPAPLPSDIPVFLAQGSADGLVRPSVTEGYRARLCRNGSNVDFVLLPGVGHAFIAPDAASTVVCSAIILFWDNPVFGFFGLPVPTRQLPVNSLFPDLYDKSLAALVEARKKAGVTQAQLAAKLGRPQSFVAKYEGRERRLDVAEYLMIARAVGADPYRLLRGAEKK